MTFKINMFRRNPLPVHGDIIVNLIDIDNVQFYVDQVRNGLILGHYVTNDYISTLDSSYTSWPKEKEYSILNTSNPPPSFLLEELCYKIVENKL